MRTEVTDIPRRTWAPFVGAALAALTAGSLVVFSLVAQRTSLDGFPDRRIAPADSIGDPTPSSITIAPVDEGADGERVASATPDTSTDSATSLLEVAPLIPPTPTVAATTSDRAGPAVPPSDDGATLARAAAPTGSFRAEQPLLTRQAGGGNAYEEHGIYAAAGWDARHGGKHTHKSHDVKGRGPASKGKDARNRAKKAKKAKAAGRKAAGRHPSAGHDNGRGASGHAPSAAPPSRSKPAAAHKSAAGPKRSSGSPPAHSNAGGNGKSRGRRHGRG